VPFLVAELGPGGTKRICRSQRWRNSFATSAETLQPSFGGVESDDPNRAFVLAFRQIEDGLDVSFTINRAIAAKVIDDQLNVLIVSFRHD
jgi:hypothetical protein